MIGHSILISANGLFPTSTGLRSNPLEDLTCTFQPRGFQSPVSSIGMVSPQNRVEWPQIGSCPPRSCRNMPGARSARERKVLEPGASVAEGVFGQLGAKGVYKNPKNPQTRGPKGPKPEVSTGGFPLKAKETFSTRLAGCNCRLDIPRKRTCCSFGAIT